MVFMGRVLSVMGMLGFGLLLSGCGGGSSRPITNKTEIEQQSSNGKTGAVEATIYKGDSLYVKISGINPEINQQEEVNEFGTIMLPYIKEVRAEGLTPGILARKIERTYIDRGYYTKLSVSVTPGAREFYANGELRIPGKLLWSPGLTLTRAISLAGSFSEKSGIQHIRFIRIHLVDLMPGKFGRDQSFFNSISMNFVIDFGQHPLKIPFQLRAVVFFLFKPLKFEQ